MAVKCRLCNQEWERDPALEVNCPVCPANVGQECQRPSGHVLPFGHVHADRDRLAMQELPNYGPCPIGSN